MTTDLPIEDQPPAQWRRFGPTIDAEAAAARPKPSLQDPVTVGGMFCEALEDPAQYLTALQNLTTPESHEAWGDFTAAAAFLASIENPGYGSMVNYAAGAPDVCYYKILSGVEESYQVLDDQPIMVAAALTLVWRPEFDRWLVHSIGEPQLPEKLPRTA